MNTINEIFNEVLNDIVPNDEDIRLINEIVDKLKLLLINRARELNIEYTCIEPQGSTGIKQTQLKGDFDIDIFIGLPYEKYEPTYEGLSKNKVKIASKKVFLDLCNEWIIKSLDSKVFHNPGLLYAEHPYVMVEYNHEINVKIDIVLYFEIDLEFIKKNGPITAVDRSPWHGIFVRDNLTNKQKNDVRLLKQFFKACHAYGDKSAVGKVGFIGYSAELLVYHFGTIRDVFENFKDLIENPLDYFKRPKQILKKIARFQRDCLVITDPVDMNRNVASSISEKAYKYVNKKIKDFLRNPNKNYFDIISIPEADLSKSDKIFVLEFNNIDKTVHYTIGRDKLYSLGDALKANGEREYSHAERFGKIIFEVYFEDVVGEFNLVLYCSQPHISNTYARKGPPRHKKNHVIKFKKKNQDYFERDGFLWVNSKRNYVNFLDFLKDFIKNKIPKNLALVNVSDALHSKTASCRKAIYVLQEMVLKFYL